MTWQGYCTQGKSNKGRIFCLGSFTSRHGHTRFSLGHQNAREFFFHTAIVCLQVFLSAKVNFFLEMCTKNITCISLASLAQSKELFLEDQ